MKFSGVWRSTTAKRAALVLAGVASAAALVSATSFALFTSAAQKQTDTFTAGTVILGQTAGTVCQIKHMEPGDHGHCTYTVTYSGSLHAWVNLTVKSSTVANQVYTAPGSVTPMGGEALLADCAPPPAHTLASTCIPADMHALQVTVSDSLGDLLTAPAVFCPTTDSTAAGAQEGSGDLGSSTACNGSTTPQMLHAMTGDTGSNNRPYGSWQPGQSDTVTVDWSLPLSAPNTYQGASADITLQATAEQASNTGCNTFSYGGYHGCELQGANLSGVTGLSGVSLRGANLTNASLQGDLLGATNFTGANLSGANFNGALAQLVNFTGANLTGATFLQGPYVLLGGSDTTAVLNEDNLTAANLSGANLTDANLVGDLLTGANLTGANLDGAFVKNSDLYGVTWSNTTCPDGTNSNNDGGTCIGHL